MAAADAHVLVLQRFVSVRRHKVEMVQVVAVIHRSAQEVTGGGSLNDNFLK